MLFQVCSVQFSLSVMSNPSRPHGLQHARLPWLPLPTLGAYSDSCPLSRWCHPTISSSVIPLLLPPLIIPSIRALSSESVLCIRWPKYWSFSFSISPSNEYSGLIFFRRDWLDLLAVQGAQESAPTEQFKSISSSVLNSRYEEVENWAHISSLKISDSLKACSAINSFSRSSECLIPEWTLHPELSGATESQWSQQLELDGKCQF